MTEEKPAAEKATLKEHLEDIQSIINDIDICDIPKDCEKCDKLWECLGHTMVIVRFLLKARKEDLAIAPMNIIKKKLEELSKRQDSGMGYI